MFCPGFAAINSDLDVTAGYSWQRFNNKGHDFSIADPLVAQSDITFTDPNLNNGNPVALKDYAGYQYGPTSFYRTRYATVDTVVEEREVKTEVPSGGFFPLEVGVVGNPVALKDYAGYQYGPTSFYRTRYQLVSFFGRVNYTGYTICT